MAATRPESSPLPCLPEEIIREILLRLPVKPLLKFRCVSKSWLNLISSYEFAKAHIRISTKSNIYNHDRLIFGPRELLIDDTCSGLTELPSDIYSCSLRSAFDNSVATGSIYPVPDENLEVERVWSGLPLRATDGVDDFSFVGSCNGLICLSMGPYYPLSVFVYTVILWNPTTRKWKFLPDSGTDLHACDAHDISITYGFGYDDLHDDYKVVEFSTMELDAHIKIYSLRSNSWKTLKSWTNDGLCSSREHGKFLNGAVHYWLPEVYDGIGALDVYDGITALNLATETFSKLTLPKRLRNSEIKLVGCLLSVLCCPNYGSKLQYFDIWVMKEYGVGESWTKIIRIPGEFVLPGPLFMIENGKMIINYGSSLRIYDPSDPHADHPLVNCNEILAITYFESLVSPNFLTEE